jgi:hypothetical protein
MHPDNIFALAQKHFKKMSTNNDKTSEEKEQAIENKVQDKIKNKIQKKLEKDSEREKEELLTVKLGCNLEECQDPCTHM